MNQRKVQKMKKRIKFAVLFSLLSAGLHFYLSQRSYQIQAGQVETSQICNISETLNCDSVLESSYSSFLGLPLSNFGFSFNLFLALILIGLMTQLLSSASYWKNLALYLAGFIALTSIIMTILSFRINAFCPVCLILYALSFLLFGLLFFEFKEDHQKIFLLQSLKNKLTFISFVSLFLMAGFIHIIFVNQFDLREIKRKNKLVYIDWIQAQAENFKYPPVLSLGNKTAKMRIVEFADPLCFHCKKAHKILKSFLKNHSDVNFQFYLFPLDKQCNINIQHSGGGRSCELSKAIICGEKQNKGLEVHDIIFEQQKKFTHKTFVEILKTIEQKTNVNLDLLKFCMNSAQTKRILEHQAFVGTELGIPGTPTLFVNEKRIHSADINSVLKGLYKKLND